MEDIGRVDWTANLVPERQRVRAAVVAKESAVLCGQAWFDGGIRALDPSAAIRWNMREVDTAAKGTVVCTITAEARALLSAERAALNFLQIRARRASAPAAGRAASCGCPPRGSRADWATRPRSPRRSRVFWSRRQSVGGGSNHRMALWMAS